MTITLSIKKIADRLYVVTLPEDRSAMCFALFPDSRLVSDWKGEFTWRRSPNDVFYLHHESWVNDSFEAARLSFDIL